MKRTTPVLLFILILFLFLALWDSKASVTESAPTPRGNARGITGATGAGAQGFIVEAVGGSTACRAASAEEAASATPRDDDPRTPAETLLPGQRPRALGENSADGLTIDLTALSQLSNDPDSETVVAAFKRAAATWSGRIKSPVSVRVNIDYGLNMPGGGAFAPNVLGSTDSRYFKLHYPALRYNLSASASSPPESAIYNALPTSAVPTDDGVADFVTVSHSLALALGIPAPPPAGEVATISFNKNIAFDFNPDDGIEQGKVDFVCVAAHEIGHALGFISTAGNSVEPPSVWDIFRFRPDVSAATFSTAARVTAVGGEQVYFTGQTFTAAGQPTDRLPLSTGGQVPTPGVGDGRQSSHWKDDDDESGGGVFIGIMDPTLDFGEHKEATENDFSALETIGWNLTSVAPPPPPPPTPQPPVQRDAMAAETSSRGNPTQTLGTSLSGSFASLEVKYEGSCRPSPHYYGLSLIEYSDSTYSPASFVRSAGSVTRKVSSGCGTATDVWTASDFSSTFAFDTSKFYAFMLYQLDARPRGSELDTYPHGYYNTQDAQPSNLKDLYFVMTLSPVVSPPSVSSLRPTSAAPGARIFVNGSGFGQTQGNGLVTFGAAGADVVSWADTQIVALAPEGRGGTVPVVVTTSLGASDGVDFTYLPSSAECPSVVRQQSGIDFCGEGLDVPNDCGGYGGDVQSVNRFAQVFTSGVSASPGKFAVKVGGFYNTSVNTANFKAYVYDTADPNSAGASNLVAHTDTLNVNTSQQGQNVVLSFPAGAPQLAANHTYTWVLEITPGYGSIVGSAGPKGSNDDGNNPGGVAYVWYQNSFRTGVEISGNNSLIPRYYYFALCGQPTATEPSADLSITKTASVNPAEVGRIFTYDINVSNAGPYAATGVTVTDTLPASVTFASATPSQGSCAFASGKVTCQLGSIAANGSASVALQVKPRQTGALENTASVSAAESDPNTSNNSATSNVNVVKTADLKVSKSDSADPIFVGQQTTYTMLVTNLGPLNGAAGVVLTDSLPASMQFVSATTTQGTLVTPPVGSTGIVTANLGALAVGAQATVTVTAKATQSGSISNTASVSSNETDTAPANNTAAQTTTVRDASLLKVLLAKQVLTGGCESTTGNVYLTGPAPPGGVTVTLSSNVSGAAVPASAFVPAGQSASPAFALTTSTVAAKQTGLVTATLGAASVSRGVTVNVGSGTCP